LVKKSIPLFVICCLVYLAVMPASCAVLPASQSTVSAAPIALKYPVVLVHGIVMQDRQNLVKIWGRIPETLSTRGIRVYFGNTDAWGDYESNASILKETIEKVLAETGEDKVNIIAHSKGGLDSRYLIWKHDFGGKVASLTTICTPHHGAEIADLIAGQYQLTTEFAERITGQLRIPVGVAEIAKEALMVIGKLSTDINPNLHNVMFQLTTGEMRVFNEHILPDERVYYNSIYTTMNSALDDSIFYQTYLYINNISGANDGIVSEVSALWGPKITRINGRISHSDIIDFKGIPIYGIDIPYLYVAIAAELSELGF